MFKKWFNHKVVKTYVIPITGIVQMCLTINMNQQLNSWNTEHFSAYTVNVIGNDWKVRKTSEDTIKI